MKTDQNDDSSPNIPPSPSYHTPHQISFKPAQDNCNSTEIPLIDFAPFLNNQSDQSSKIQTSNEILEAFKKYGFIYLYNIPISSEKVEKALEWVYKTQFSFFEIAGMNLVDK